jgi:hypothetical protein
MPALMPAACSAPAPDIANSPLMSRHLMPMTLYCASMRRFISSSTARITSGTSRVNIALFEKRNSEVMS